MTLMVTIPALCRADRLSARSAAKLSVSQSTDAVSNVGAQSRYVR